MKSFQMLTSSEIMNEPENDLKKRKATDQSHLRSILPSPQYWQIQSSNTLKKKNTPWLKMSVSDYSRMTHYYKNL